MVCEVINWWSFFCIRMVAVEMGLATKCLDFSLLCSCHSAVLLDLHGFCECFQLRVGMCLKMSIVILIVLKSLDCVCGNVTAVDFACRFGKPEECAGAVSFLVSDDSSYMTGETILVSGGMTARL